MKHIKRLLAVILVAAMMLAALPMVSFADDTIIYAIATAHLDTIWNWTYETTIGSYIPKTFNNNFSLFEQYPNYVFNFEGARRYALMEEYYPADFQKVAQYIAAGRWNTAGSGWENGDQNGPSPENHVRNVLYGNQYFADKFGNDKRSRDIYLPDCFGFGAAMPEYETHCNLISFSTQKLSWGNTFPNETLPFDIGTWTGPSGATILVSIKNGSYSADAPSNVRTNSNLLNKAASNAKYGWNATTFYHGTGDTGGSPSSTSVSRVNSAFNGNDSSNVKVLFSDTWGWAKDIIDKGLKDDMPNWDQEFLLREHGVGSYTARAIGHRWMSRNELLALAAENTSLAAEWLGIMDYNKARLTEAWLRVIGHTFHDDITGTSLNTEYLRSWNEYNVSLNQFSNEYEAGVSSVASVMDTSAATGVALVVNNPVAIARNDTVTATVDMGKAVNFIRVYDAQGNEVPSQILKKNGNKVDIIFQASVPSMGYKVYDVREATSASKINSGLVVTRNSLSNSKYTVTLNDNGDIASIYDKEIGKELLASPIRLGLLNDTETEWPSWELKFTDYAFQSPKAYVEDSARQISIEENGAARVALRVTRSFQNSTYDQVISLDAGGDAVEIQNVVNWAESSTMLKAVFNTASAANKATYDVGMGAIERANNTQYQAEVPAQKWADVTNSANDFGVSILSDSKNGWDKPSDDILRLTLIHTPTGSYGDDHGQNYLERGENRFGFAVFGHAGKVGGATQIAAQKFTQPMVAYQTVAHTGFLGSEYSFASVSNTDVIVRAIKKGETGTGLANTGDEYVVRFNEGANKLAQNVEFTIGAGITAVREVYGSEESMSAQTSAELGAYSLVDGKLVFDIKPYSTRAFAFKLAAPATSGAKVQSVPVTLPYNVDAISSNANKADSTLTARTVAFPAELIPATITTGGISFAINKNADSENNMVLANGQTIALPEGNYSKLYILAASLSGDTRETFVIGDTSESVEVADYGENVGQWDIHDKTLDADGYVKTSDVGFMATHRHVDGKDSIAKSTYLFKYEFDIPAGATTFTLPKDTNLLIASATVTGGEYDGALVTEVYDQREKAATVDGTSYFFGFEDDEVKALENTQSSEGGVSNISYISGTSSADAHTGTKSFAVQATRTTGNAGNFYAYTAVHGTSIKIKDDTYIEYWVKAMDDNAKFIGLDLILAGGNMRDYPTQEDRNVVDTEGNLMHPEYHAVAMKTVGEWTKFRCNLGDFMEGSTITEINFCFDMGPSSRNGVPAEGTHIAYIDDIYIGNGAQEAVDMTALMSAYTVARSMDTDNYTAASIKLLNDALEETKELVYGGTATQAEVDALAAKIVDIYNNRMKKVPTFTNFSSFEDNEPKANQNTGAKNGGTRNTTFVSGTTSEDAHTGKNSFKLEVTKTSNSAGFAYASIYTYSIPITSNMYIEYWLKATDDVSKYINIDVYVNNQSPVAIRDYTAAVDTNGVRTHPAQHGASNIALNEWVKYRVNIGSFMSGKTMSEIVLAFDTGSCSGTHTAYFDDLYIGTENGINLVPIYAMIETAESIERANYTDESLAALDVQIAAAKAAAADENMTQASIDAAKAALSTAYVALEKKEVIVDKPYIVSVDAIDDLNVEYGTAFESINLPSTVGVTLSTGEDTVFVVDWDGEGYNAAKAGTYAITGTIRTTSDVDNKDNLKAAMNVIVVPSADDDLISIAAIPAITVENGAAKTVEGLGLPTTVDATCTQGTYPAAITWNLNNVEYDPQSVAEQSFTVNGVVTLPETVSNSTGVSLNVTANVTVKVKPADYCYVDKYVAQAAGINRSLYTEDSLAALDEALAAVIRGLDIEHQDEVTGMANDIYWALDNLVKKNADYSAVDAAIASAPNAAYGDNYTTASWEALMEAIDAVEYDLMADKQDKVDAMAAAINNAVNALVKAGAADYTAVDAAIAKANEYDADNYTNFNAVEDAIANVTTGLNENHQDEVDAMAKAIEDAIAALELKPAEYTLEAEKDYYMPDETITFTAKVPASIVKVGLENETGRTIVVTSSSYVPSETEGYNTWTFTAAIATTGDRTLSLVAYDEEGTKFDTGAKDDIIIAKVLPTGKDDVAVLGTRVPDTAYVNEAFAVTVKTTTTAAKVGIFDAETGKAFGKISQSYVDKDGVRTWTITMKIGSKGTRDLSIKAADIEGNWTDGLDASIGVSKARALPL